MPISQDELKTALQTLLNTIKFRLLARRGLAAQLDLSTMKAGEFAMATDTQEVYACFGSGVFRSLSRGITIMGTYADLSALQAAHPTGNTGDIYAAGGAPQHLYCWQDDAWTDMGAWNDMSLYATNASVVHLAGVETITGLKSVPTPTADAHIAPKSYVDQNINFVRANGLNPITETFTYASATTITVASGALSRFSKGDKLMLTQHGVTKFFVIVAVANTLLTVCAGSDFAVENTATYPITAIYLSKIENPQGFPTYFNWTPVITALAGTPTTITSALKIKISGNMMNLFGLITVVNKGTASSVMRVTIPVSAIDYSCGAMAEGLVTGALFMGSIVAGNNFFDVGKYDGTTPFVNGYGFRTNISALF